MPGDDEELHVVQKFLGCHATAGLGILGLEHVVEQVVGGPGCPRRDRAPPLLDGARDHGVHGPDRAYAQHRSRSRHPVRDMQEIEHRGPADSLHIPDDGLAIEFDVEVFAARKRHVADDIEGCREHLADHLGLAAAPRQALCRALRRGRHHRRQRGHVALREDRRDGAALPAPGIAFGGEQAVAHRRAQHAQHDLGFRVVADIVEEDAPQRAGILHHVPAAAEPPGHHRLDIR